MRQIVVGAMFGFVGAVSVAHGEEPYRVYWTDAGNGFPDPEGTGRITRASIDGSRVEVVYTHTFEDPIGIGLDWRRRKMYWTSTPCTCIMRSNLDGSEVELILEWDLFESTLEDVVVDGVGKKIYWADQTMDKIRRANLDGTEVEDLVVIDAKNNADSAVLGIDFDRVLNAVFWADWRRETIETYSLDTGRVTIVRDNVDFAYGIDVDGLLRLLHYTKPTLGVRRLSLDDGSDALLVIDSPIVGIAVSGGPERVFWDRRPPITIPDIGALRYSDLDGANIEFLVETGLEAPVHIEVLPEEVDLSDFAAFVGCVTGPGVGAPPSCESSDFDNDGDVDFADFGRFQFAFTGPFD